MNRMAKFDLNELKKRAIKITDNDFSDVDGTFLRDLRMKLNMSQLLFASYLGVSKKAIEKWEQGANKINAPTARLLFLIEKDPNILSYFKTITIGEKKYQFKFEEQYVVEQKPEKEIAVSFSSELWINSRRNDYVGKQRIMDGGNNYANACL